MKQRDCNELGFVKSNPCRPSYVPSKPPIQHGMALSAIRCYKHDLSFVWTILYRPAK